MLLAIEARIGELLPEPETARKTTLVAEVIQEAEDKELYPANMSGEQEWFESVGNMMGLGIRTTY